MSTAPSSLPHFSGSLNLGICASPRWPPFTDAILEIVQTGWQTGLWRCHHGFQPQSALASWANEGKRFDVIVGALMDSTMIGQARSCADMVVSFSSCIEPDTSITNVLFDPEAIGQVAAQHFQEQGMVAAAVYQPIKHWGLQRRGEVFTHSVKRVGLPFLGSFSDLTQLPLDSIRQAAGAVGVFVPDDEFANTVASYLHENDISIPYQAMVLGVNDQEYLCHFSPVPLSSVKLDGAAMGRACVSLLKRRLAGGTSHPRTIWVPPLGVTVRASSNGAFLGDSLVSRALQTLRQDKKLPLTVEAWASRVGSSRRPLEKRLREAFVQTPKQLLDAERIRRAIYALRQTQQDMESIASHAGFSSGRHLRETLQRTLGKTPSEIRTAETSPELNIGKAPNE